MSGKVKTSDTVFQEKKSKRRILYDYICITIASLIQSAAISLFLDPNNLAPGGVSGISIILTTLMIVTWVLEVLLELIIMIIEDKKDLLVDAFNKDIEDIKKPVTKVNNFIRKIRGEEVIEEINVSKNIRILEKKINEGK